MTSWNAQIAAGSQIGGPLLTQRQPSSTNDAPIASSRAGEGRSTMAFYVAMSGFIAANLTVIGAEMRNMRDARKSPARNR